jgi:DegV family protein with EDD domain
VRGGEPTKNVAVITDSVACLNRELAEKYEIGIIPLYLYAGGKSYRDGVDITPSEAYKLFLEDPDSFNTSSASPMDCLEVFRQASQRARNILCITLSTGLSTLYNAAVDARELARDELPGITIEVMDSHQATPAEGMIALSAARAAIEGKDLPQVVQAAEKVKAKVNTIVLLDTIKYVYRSGRVPRIASMIGSALNIRPVLTVSGTVHFSSMVRSRKQGIERILQMMRDRVGNRPVHVAVTHAYVPDEAERLKERISAEFNCIEIWLSEFSPIMGYACGTGTIGTAFYPEEKEGQ